MGKVLQEFYVYLCALFYYIQKRLRITFWRFESTKNIFVGIFVRRRGIYNLRPFFHIFMIFIFIAGLLLAPLLADRYPTLGRGEDYGETPSSVLNTETSLTDVETETKVSEKPRDKVVSYYVAKGDTVSEVAEAFGVSGESVKWLNNIRGDSLKIGQELLIPPVTGVIHKVQRGETVYSIAKKYKVDAQKIVNWPYTDFSNDETFELIAGQSIVVPDGVPPEEVKPVTYVAQKPATPYTGPVAGGKFAWPMRGGISQYPVWYHMAVDITNPVGTPIVAGKNGKVISAQSLTWGYGKHVIIDHGDGFSSLYAHMSGFNVGVGQSVTGGSTVVGWVGMTGRTTGPHLHFEIRKNGVTINPLGYLQ